MTAFFGESGTVIISEVPDYSTTPSLSLIRGKHSIKKGGDFQIGLLNFVQLGGPSGQFTFDQAFTTSDPLHPSGGFSFDSFMLGYPGGGFRSRGMMPG